MLAHFLPQTVCLGFLFYRFEQLFLFPPSLALLSEPALVTMALGRADYLHVVDFLQFGRLCFGAASEMLLTGI